MSGISQDMRNELERVRGVSDMLCTMHAGLRDRYAHYAFWLEITVLGLSTWLVALAFVEPQINISLTPFNLNPTLWIGLIAVGTFFLTIIQMKADWRGRSDAHKRVFAMYSEVKRECGYLLASGHQITEQECQRVLTRYDMAADVGVEVPEKEFLCQKKRHKMKVAISKHLDTHPAASILLTKIQFFFRDNF